MSLSSLPACSEWRGSQGDWMECTSPAPAWGGEGVRKRRRREGRSEGGREREEERERCFSLCVVKPCSPMYSPILRPY